MIINLTKLSLLHYISQTMEALRIAADDPNLVIVSDHWYEIDQLVSRNLMRPGDVWNDSFEPDTNAGIESG